MSSDITAEFKKEVENITRAVIVAPAKLLLKVLKNRAREEVIDHWHEFVEDFHMDPLEFYELVH